MTATRASHKRACLHGPQLLSALPRVRRARGLLVLGFGLVVLGDLAQLLLLLGQYAYAQQPRLLVAYALQHVLEELAHRADGFLTVILLVLVTTQTRLQPIRCGGE